ncbi:phosphodiester glycosidase family protein [Bacillus salitolerans]|uniref:Phosphodiester glycosidase family protein n=1 Tax=Bacillus salitolerans TaxID=1437434 RepID=A0ABW4LNS9_9BACI
MKFIFQRLFIVLIVAQLFVSLLPPLPAVAAAETPITKEQYIVSPGVTYKNQVYQNTTQSFRVLEMNLLDPYTEVKLGIPNPISSLKTTTSQAKANSKDSHHVVGAINGSFYYTNNRLPMYLIAQNNSIINGGFTAKDSSQYVNQPIAFGINKDGRAQIDSFNLSINMEAAGNVHKIHGINKERAAEETILYTRSNHSSFQTNTNEYGTEFVIQSATPIREPLQFGDVLSGQVVKIRPKGDTTNTLIMENQFVVSVQGNLPSTLTGIKVGDPISVKISIDDKWNNAKFMLASGPMLVRDGKVQISMDTNSSRAKERAPRTAVAMDATGSKVFFVTVDGRQPGYSTGMNLTEFAEYLVSLGVNRAINLDGGGSTTLATRRYGAHYATLANSPSDGRERAVSTILQAVSTAPYGKETHIGLSIPNGKVLKGTSIDVSLKYVLDQYYNPLKYDASKLSISSSLGNFNGTKFTATQAGTGTIKVTYGSATKDLPLSVVEKIDNFKLNIPSLVMGEGQTVTLKTQASDPNGQPIIYDTSLVSWKVEGNIGTITNNGVFTSSQGKAEGKIIATIGSNTVSIPVKVGVNSELIDSFDTMQNWRNENIRAGSTLTRSTKSEPFRQGAGSAKLSYDFSVGEEGIAASYISAVNPITLLGKPQKLGVWVYGDAKNHWLRGKIVDGSGQEHTINFTEEGGLNWSGWKYAEAVLPTDIALPIKFKQIYVAEAYKERQGKGTLYFDQLQAVYSNKHVEQQFKDIDSTFWAQKEVLYIFNKGIISGYQDGTFKPGQPLKRSHAALILAKVLNLNTKNRPNPGLKDVTPNHLYYDVIATVVDEGLITGKDNGTFDGEGYLTRAQMAKILQRAYSLGGTAPKTFKDVPKSHWAYHEISALAANNITTGRADGTFSPNESVNRGQFSAFIYRTITNTGLIKTTAHSIVRPKQVYTYDQMESDIRLLSMVYP